MASAEVAERVAVFMSHMIFPTPSLMFTGILASSSLIALKPIHARSPHFPTLVAPGKTAIDTSIMFLSCWTVMTALRSSSILRCLLRSLRSSRFSFPIFMSLRLMRRMSLAMFRLTGCIMTPPALR